MRMKNCANGHYYDEALHTSCPYCAGGAVNNVTKKTKIAGENNMETKRTKVAGSMNETSGKTEIFHTGGTEKAPISGGETVYMMAGGKELKDVTESAKTNTLLSGWLVVVSEEGKGRSYSLTFGMNSIGREAGNHVHIDNGDNSISRQKHTIIIYDYQNNLFFIKHGDGQYLSYLNGEVLLDTKELKANDRIKVGNTELIFIPLCSEAFAWEM